MAFEVTVPSPGESVSEVIIDSWLVEDGAYVERDAELAEIQSDKAMLSLYAEKAGKISIKVQEGETVEVGAVVAAIDTDAAPEAGGGNDQPQSKPEESSPAEASEQQQQQEPQTPEAEKSYASGVPSPAADKHLKAKGLEADEVSGTGRGGRITKGDVLKHEKQPAKANNGQPKKDSGKKEQQKDTPAAQPMVPFSREERREKMTPLRRTLGNRLVGVKNETAMLTTFQEVDMSAVMNLRKRYKETFEKKHGERLGFMGFFTKACVQALHEFPSVNAYIDGQEVVYHDYVDMGIAVSTDRGLVVPVIRNAESLQLHQIETEVNRLAGKARENRITIDEMTGGTFTITNGGVFGSLLSTPILNPPQSAILGMHRIEQRPIAVDGEVVIRPMMYLALSYDHRIIDGKESVSFLFRVKEILEDPARLVLGV